MPTWDPPKCKTRADAIENQRPAGHSGMIRWRLKLQSVSVCGLIRNEIMIVKLRNNREGKLNMKVISIVRQPPLAKGIEFA